MSEFDTLVIAINNLPIVPGECSEATAKQIRTALAPLAELKPSASHQELWKRGSRSFQASFERIEQEIAAGIENAQMVLTEGQSVNVTRTPPRLKRQYSTNALRLEGAHDFVFPCFLQSLLA